MFLSGSQRQQIVQALNSAFYSQGQLDMLVSFKLNETLAVIAGSGLPLNQLAFNLVLWAERGGKLDVLLRGAIEEVPGNPLLQNVVRELLGDAAGLPPSDPAQQPRRVLERWIRENPFFDAGVWLPRLGTILRQVCRIQVPEAGQALFGTGFLVSPDTVLTNYHVVEPVIRGQTSPAQVVLTFDYRRSPDGREPGNGREYRLKPALGDAVVDSSPYSQADLVANATTPPAADELDYALLRVEGTPGNDVLEAEPRGFVQLVKPDYDFPRNSALFIVQHPEGQPLQLAMDTSADLEVKWERRRVRYKTNTLGGSSGSPCFNANLELVALHHSGDPNFDPLHRAEYNEGIPIGTVLDRVRARGHAAALAI